MSTTIIPFQFQDREVRVVDVDGEPWFVLSDLCRILDIANPRNVAARLADDMKGVRPVDTLGGAQQMTTVSEAGMYSVVMRSDKPQSEPFRRWVTSEVLPAIRQHGGYLTEQKIEEVLTDPDTLIHLATQLKEARAAQQREQKAREAVESYARDLEPRADGYDRFISGDGTYSVGSAAKLLGLSQNKLFAELRNCGVLIAKGAMANTPYQRYMHHFAVKAYSYDRQDGTTGTSYTTRVQPSGLEFIARKLGLPQPLIPEVAA